MIKSIIALLIITSVQASEFLGPTLRSEVSGDSWHILVDSSRKRHRFLKTYTFLFPPESTSGMKLQSELLFQRFIYPNPPFSSAVWIPQFSWGTSFKKLLGNRFVDSYDLDFFASYSWGKLLGNERLYFLPFNGWGVQGGIEKRVPFLNTTFGAWLLYEFGRSYKRFHGHGYAFGMKHDLPNCFVLSEKATFRVPFNYYEVSFKWAPGEEHALGLFGELHENKLDERSKKYNMGIQWDIRIPIRVKHFQKEGNVPEEFWKKVPESRYPYASNPIGTREKIKEEPEKEERINVEISFDTRIKEEVQGEN